MNHHASQLYLPELARLAHMSETVFRRKFKEFFHVSPTRFIAQVRIRNASHVMATSAASMGEIAERCGFPNPAYFSRVFKRVTGRPQSVDSCRHARARALRRCDGLRKVAPDRHRGSAMTETGGPFRSQDDENGARKRTFTYDR